MGIFCLKQAQNRLLILRYHLNELNVNFQKIIKLTLLDQQN